MLEWALVDVRMKMDTYSQEKIFLVSITLTDDFQIAEKMNECFASKGETLDSQIPISPKMTMLIFLHSNALNNLFTYLPSLLLIATKSSLNWKLLKYTLTLFRFEYLKKNVNFIVEPLTYITNTSYTLGFFPGQFNSARVTYPTRGIQGNN